MKIAGQSGVVSSYWAIQWSNYVASERSDMVLRMCTVYGLWLDVVSLYACDLFLVPLLVILPGHIGRHQDAGIKIFYLGAIHFMPRIGTPVK